MCDFTAKYKENPWSDEEVFQCAHTPPAHPFDQDYPDNYCPLHVASINAELLNNPEFIEFQQTFIKQCIEGANEKDVSVDFRFIHCHDFRLPELEINNSLLLDYAIIGGDARLYSANIGGDARLSSANIGGDAWLSSANIGGDARLSSANIGGDARLSSANIGGDARLSSANIGGDAWLSSANIGGDAWLYSANIGGDAWLSSANIGGDAWLSSANIGGDAWLDSANIGGDAWLSSANIGGDAWLSSANIGGDAWLDSANIGGDAWLSSANIGGDARLSSANIGGDAWLDSANIKKQLIIKSSRCRLLSIENCSMKRLEINSSHWQTSTIKNNDWQDARFINCGKKSVQYDELKNKLHKNKFIHESLFGIAVIFAPLREVNYDLYINLIKECWQKNNERIIKVTDSINELRNKSKQAHWDFSQTDLGQCCFTDCDLSSANFISTIINQADFDACTFSKDIDNSWQGLHGHKAIVNQYKKNDSNADKIKTLQAAYLRFKSYFERQADYERANGFHWHEMEIRRQLTDTSMIQKLMLALYKWSSTYGLSWIKPLILALLSLIIVFPLALSLPKFWALPSWEWYSIFEANLQLLTSSIFPKTLANTIGINIVDTESTINFIGFWPSMLVIFHSLTIYTLTTLFILSLRRRFKR